MRTQFRAPVVKLLESTLERKTQVRSNIASTHVDILSDRRAKNRFVNENRNIYGIETECGEFMPATGNTPIIGITQAKPTGMTANLAADEKNRPRNAVRKHKAANQ
jgi:hypothetical protein